jgi:hypothetical protein
LTGSKKEVASWALKHSLPPKAYLRVFLPRTLRQFAPGTPYVTVGEWVYNSVKVSTTGKQFFQPFPRKGVFEMLVAAENAKLSLVRDLAE